MQPEAHGGFPVEEPPRIRSNRMNLVAKELVAARDDERGALVLSQLTGAAREREAVCALVAPSRAGFFVDSCSRLRGEC